MHEEHHADVVVILAEGNFHFLELVFVLDLLRDLGETKVVLKHLLDQRWSVQSVVAEYRSGFVETLVSG